MKRSRLTVLVLLLGAVAITGYWLEKPERAVTSAPKVSSPLPNEATNDSKSPSRDGGGAPPTRARRAYSLDESVFAPEGTAAEVVQQLGPRAERGDARASLLIFLKLNECASLPNEQQQSVLSERLAQAGASREAMSSSYAQKRKDCASSSGLLAERGRWLEMAAAAGDEQAQLLYASFPEAVLGGGSQMLRDPEKIVRYKATALRYMNDLAARGSVDAMMRLAGAYDAGVMVSQDPARSYAYYLAINMARPGTISESLIGPQRDKVPSEKMAEANDLARKIYSNCCSN